MKSKIAQQYFEKRRPKEQPVEILKGDIERGFDCHGSRIEKVLFSFRFSPESVSSEEHLTEFRRKNIEVFRLDTLGNGVIYVIQLNDNVFALNTDGPEVTLQIHSEKDPHQLMSFILHQLPFELRTERVAKEISAQLSRWMTVRSEDWQNAGHHSLNSPDGDRSK